MCVGAIEEILMDESFVNTQNTFCVRHCDKFEDTEENKMIYTSLFEEYTELMENMLNSSLEAKIPVSLTYLNLVFTSERLLFCVIFILLGCIIIGVFYVAI